MVCDDFIFKLTSGQLATAGIKDRLFAKAHTLICSNCRHFQKNDQIIDRYLANYREDLDPLEK